MKTYHVYIETSQDALEEGGPLAHVPELPGCTARAKTVDAAKEAIRKVARDYITFLRAQGEHDLPGEFDLEFEETDKNTFAQDYVTMKPEEITQAKRWLEASRRAVVAELANLPTDAWDWKPGKDDWPLRAITAHMGSAELWYTDRLMQPDHAPFDRLKVTRRVAFDRLDALAPEHRGRVMTFDGEDWTPRKVMRRMLEHEQEHLAQIRTIISQYRHNAG
jgi:predicted RNase H-like HicB family nuclease